MKGRTMRVKREVDPILGELFLAGERVEAGAYREIVSGRIVCIRPGETLPASLDGTVACYTRQPVPRQSCQCEHAQRRAPR